MSYICAVTNFCAVTHFKERKTEQRHIIIPDVRRHKVCVVPTFLKNSTPPSLLAHVWNNYIRTWAPALVSNMVFHRQLLHEGSLRAVARGHPKCSSCLYGSPCIGHEGWSPGTYIVFLPKFTNFRVEVFGINDAYG